MIGGGLQQGENLFHSFERFNVEAGATVLFQDPGVSNILGRVTGNQASEILGTLGVSGGDANLFLINPNGIIFGENSSLDLNGSFLATTADAIRFGEQGLLDTTPNEIPLLTINPSALSFTDGNQGVIRNESVAPAGADLSGLEETASGLRVPDGKSFLLVGGDVIFDGGRVNAFGGRVDLGGLANAGEIQLSFSDTDEGKIDLSFPEQLQRANILLTDKALINVPASDGGDIKIHASNISIENGSILRAGIGANLGNSNSKAGNIILDATENLEIANSTLITNQVAPGGLGNGGNININSGSLEIFDKSRVQTVTFGNGDAGEIEIKVPNSSVEISDESGIVSVVGLIDLDGMKIFGVGNGGDIQIESKNVVIKNKSIIDASTSGQGDAGNISILSNGNINLSLDSGIRSVIDEDAVGDAGNIQIEANNVFLSRGSQLTAAVIGRGKGGNISLDIFNSLNITGFDEAEGRSSGIITATQSDAFGQAGSIQIDSEDFQIAEGAIITSQTLNESDGGNITIDASSFSAIDGGQVVTSAASSGNAGDINIEASDNILLSGSDNNFANRLAEFGEETVGNEAPGNSGFFANVRSEASGEGGNINVAAGQLDINDSAEINVSAEGTGGAGSLSIDAQDVTLDVGSLTAETRVGSQGNVSLNGLDTLLLRNNSQITTNASESAIGGDITISSDGIVLLDNSDITANAVEGQGGNIQITTQGIFQEPDSEIT
ncbi:MAG: filamentous hemagglutinin N-terminal domain-containing protein, partial [Cyanobacteria bacterium P01_G01_bin.19]